MNNTQLGNSSKAHYIQQKDTVWHKKLFIKMLQQKQKTTILQLRRLSLSSHILSSLGARMPAPDLLLLLRRILCQKVNKLRPIALTASSKESEGYLGTVGSRWHLGG